MSIYYGDPFDETNNEITITREHHYKLVAPEELTPTELAAYRNAAKHSPN